jgi:hypothetical protein
MTDVHLNHQHCVAVCSGIGERLAAALGSPSRALPPHLLALLEQLANVEPGGSPS